MTNGNAKKMCAQIACAVAVSGASVRAEEKMSVFTSGGDTAALRGVYEIVLHAEEMPDGAFFDETFGVVFTLPSGKKVTAEGFYAGAGKRVARAYCAEVGTWAWQSLSSVPALDGKRGTFEVVPSDFPGKLRKHPEDPHQFAFDNGEWFLHLGDTAYRYATDTEPLWQPYIDEAAQVGFNKIRVWFCRARHDVAALFADDRRAMNLAYWDEIERRLRYALERYPRIQFQLIPYGEDWREIERYGKGDAAAAFVAKYAQARFSAFPNVQWCMSNDSYISETPGKINAHPDTIEKMGAAWKAREPWGTLLTNHQRRFQGYSFAGADWSDIVTLQDRDQVAGKLIARYVAAGDDPVVLDEDRYGIYISPKHNRYFFRRLMWASILSGGHATYGGLNTHEAFAGTNDVKGVQGYLTAVADGRLADGAADFRHIKTFFAETRLTMVGFRSANELAGNAPERVNVATNGTAIIAYLHNASETNPANADMGARVAESRLALPPGAWRVRWFDPRTGAFHDGGNVEGGDVTLTAAFPGDAVALLEVVGP